MYVWECPAVSWLPLLTVYSSKMKDRPQMKLCSESCSNYMWIRGVFSLNFQNEKRSSGANPCLSLETRILIPSMLYASFTLSLLTVSFSWEKQHSSLSVCLYCLFLSTLLTQLECISIQSWVLSIWIEFGAHEGDFRTSSEFRYLSLLLMVFTL